MTTRFTISDGGVTAPRGFRAAGVEAGIKSPRRDLALLASEAPAVIAGVFTTNRVQAAPVLLCKARLAEGAPARAIVINSGCANACTGERGLRDAERMAVLTAGQLQAPVSSVYVCSTGTIGIPLPMDRVEAGIRQAAAALSAQGGAAAAEAIMTTDTRPKRGSTSLEIDGCSITLGGMAKGSGMIHPAMATLLVFLTTDAAVGRADLQCVLDRAVGLSFNRLSVDGDRSTNDTALFMANGAAGNAPLRRGRRGWRRFAAAAEALCAELARQIARDGEGATKLVVVRVRGAASRRAAEQVARAVSNSLLVKTSWFGADPNWGRVLCAAGYSGAAFDPARVSIAYNGLEAVRGGEPTGLDPARLRDILLRPEFELEIDLHAGRGCYSMTTCDCSEAYVRINAAYMT